MQKYIFLRPKTIFPNIIENYQMKNKSSSKNESRSDKRFTKKRKSTYSGRNQKKISVSWDDDTVRLNKFIAASGICSRREADDLIKAGLVSVNGKIITDLGVKVNPKDTVRYNGEKIKSERLVYVLLNKPKDFITTVKDPNATRTVLDLTRNACRERIYPVGRLDKNTTGVLLLTNDGKLTKTLTHPSYKKAKIYQVTLDKSLAKHHFNQILNGIELEDGLIKVDALSYTDVSDKKKIGIEIHSGRNRIVRRIFEHFGYRIRKLDRVYFAGLTKKGLTRGKWRFLSEREITMLKMGNYK